MQTTTATSTAPPLLHGTANVLPLTLAFLDAGLEVRSVLWNAPGYIDPEHLEVYVIGKEPAVDALADLLQLGPDEGKSNYERHGLFNGVPVRVWSGRSTPVCACGQACNHGAGQ